ncbi:hypothetical protein LA345_12930 [Burkholderia vietnamiensis]|uniref:Uncharacterized protein n=1 Tax=Burkholderia vietnamiensis (strain G4 / LMG 22486) TaxID=269482 RepID=A4JFK3_BURVG|nr:hypothetical protein Bcep1808_2054 [Burkholderia vietnamiensis G4]MCB4344816.1 hypothetical protein [Burkholderia vietnamiensis]
MSENTWGPRPRSFEELDAVEREQIEVANATIEPTALVRDATRDKLVARAALAKAERDWRPLAKHGADRRTRLQNMLDDAVDEAVAYAREQRIDRQILASHQVDLDGSTHLPASERSYGVLHGREFKRWATDTRMSATLTQYNYVDSGLGGLTSDVSHGTAEELSKQASDMMLGDFLEPSESELNAMRKQAGLATWPESNAKTSQKAPGEGWGQHSTSLRSAKFARFNEVFNDIRDGAQDQMIADHDALLRSVKGQQTPLSVIKKSIRAFKKSARAMGVEAGSKAEKDLVAQRAGELLLQGRRPHPDKAAVERRVATERALFDYQSDYLRYDAESRLRAKYGLPPEQGGAPQFPKLLKDPLLCALKSVVRHGQGEEHTPLRVSMNLETGTRLAEIVSRIETAEAALSKHDQESDRAAAALEEARGQYDAKSRRADRFIERLPGTREERDQVVKQLTTEAHEAVLGAGARPSRSSRPMAMDQTSVQTAGVATAEPNTESQTPAPREASAAMQTAASSFHFPWQSPIPALDALRPAAAPARAPQAAVESTSAATATHQISPAPSEWHVENGATARAIDLDVQAAPAERGANPVEPGAESSAVSTPRSSTPAQPANAASDELILAAHGAAPYLNNPNGPQSYFVTLRDGNGHERTEWGLNLERAIADSGLQIGDPVGRKPTAQESAPAANASATTAMTAAMSSVSTPPASTGLPEEGIVWETKAAAPTVSTPAASPVAPAVSASTSANAPSATAAADASPATAPMQSAAQPQQTSVSQLPITEKQSMNVNDSLSPAQAHDAQAPQAATSLTSLERIAMGANRAPSAEQPAATAPVEGLSGFAARRANLAAGVPAAAQQEGEGQGKHQGAGAAAAPHAPSADSQNLVSQASVSVADTTDAILSRLTAPGATEAQRAQAERARELAPAMRQNEQASADAWARARGSQNQHGATAADRNNHPLVKSMNAEFDAAQAAKGRTEAPELSPKQLDTMLSKITERRQHAQSLAAAHKQAQALAEGAVVRPKGPRM